MSDLIFAIDPGPEKSAYVEYDPTKPLRPLDGWCHVDNLELLDYLKHCATHFSVGAIEVVQSYMLRVGQDVFTTCEWIGTFNNEWRRQTQCALERLTKLEVNRHLCNKNNAGKADVRGAIYQRFGGSRRSAMGINKAPGPLYGFTGDHVWDALAVAVTWHELNKDVPNRQHQPLRKEPNGTKKDSEA